MIGVVANQADTRVVNEFFELFKTPWEFYLPGREYDVILCASGSLPENVCARLVFVYTGKAPSDAARTVSTLRFRDRRIPIYGGALIFSSDGQVLVTEEKSGAPAVRIEQRANGFLVRVGYDLFGEVRILLLKGQPAGNADCPTLDLHIELLRSLIVCCGVPLFEIPPVPAGYPFIVCLTHDLDHASIRRHKFDSTIAGFLYRATIGSALNFARGRMPLADLLRNWGAAARWPLVSLGLARDFWYEFDRYLEFEGGRPSTFFVIPFEHFPGRSAQGSAPRARGAAYDISHIAEKIPVLIAAGCEVGLHGIDAWADAARGRAERERISNVSGRPELGVRMHWLYSDENSPAVLEAAGFQFDSTVGYNQTVGYRAGTSQAFMPLTANRLMELPLHIMDTSLFYPSYLDLSPAGALAHLMPLFENATRYGGAVTVNWHDRSIAPERLWGGFYLRMIQEFSARGACFLTAGQAVEWFRRRRSVIFERMDSSGERCQAVAEASGGGNEPALTLRVHRARNLSEWGAIGKSAGGYVDTPFRERINCSHLTEAISIQN